MVWGGCHRPKRLHGEEVNPFSMFDGVIAPRLLTWGMIFSGLGFGLIVAAFVGEDDPAWMLWGAVLLGVGAIFIAMYYLVRNRHSGH